MFRLGLTLATVLLIATGCGGELPESIGGFELGLTQDEVMEAARSRGGFECRLRSSRPTFTFCEGPSEEGRVGVVVRDDSVVQLSLRLEAEPGRSPDRAVHRFVRPLGEPAWRDRPYPPRSDPPAGYHTQWVDRDSARAMALVCAGERLAPPCTAELTATTPAGVEARLDTLLGIRR